MNNVQTSAERTTRAAQRVAALAAATVVVEAEGWRALTARRLADAAGCSVGQIYNLFVNTEAILHALNLETLHALDAALGERAGPMPMLVLARAYLDFTTQHRARWAAVLEVPSPPKAASEGLDAAVARLVERVEAALAPLCSDPTLRRQHAATLWTALEGIAGLSSSGNAVRVTAAEPWILARTLVEIYTAGLASGHWADQPLAVASEQIASQ